MPLVSIGAQTGLLAMAVTATAAAAQCRHQQQRHGITNCTCTEDHLSQSIKESSHPPLNKSKQWFCRAKVDLKLQQGAWHARTNWAPLGCLSGGTGLLSAAQMHRQPTVRICKNWLPAIRCGAMRTRRMPRGQVRQPTLLAAFLHFSCCSRRGFRAGWVSGVLGKALHEHSLGSLGSLGGGGGRGDSSGKGSFQHCHLPAT